jgi:hypothetical protein
VSVVDCAVTASAPLIVQYAHFRLRLIRMDKQSHKLALAEDPKFVSSLKAQFDSISNLPYFVNVSELSVNFDCDQESVNAKANGSIANYVFTHIRKQTKLSKFLVNILSELRVVLSCYDSGNNILGPNQGRSDVTFSCC